MAGELTVGELCAGYGGLALAVERIFDATLSWYAEFEPAPSKIMAHHWPGIHNYGDMTAIDWVTVPHVDILSGGTPCQDLSTAGRRAGMSEGTRSNLWICMRKAVETIKPKYVVWENVRGVYSAKATSELESREGRVGSTRPDGPILRALGRVLGDLSGLGYDCQWRGLRAADVGAPHGRYRIFILAQLADANDARLQGQPDRTGATPARRHGHPIAGVISHTSSREAAQNPHVTVSGQRRFPAPGQTPGGRTWTNVGGRGGALVAEWGDYEPAIRRWERALGRRAPAPTEPTGRDGKHRLSPLLTEWMMGLPAGWVTDPRIGISHNNQLKVCGDGVVPQQAMSALLDMKVSGSFSPTL